MVIGPIGHFPVSAEGVRGLVRIQEIWAPNDQFDRFVKQARFTKQALMGVFIPRDKRQCKRVTHHTCRWCGERKLRKIMYKLRDGPIDWWFCDDDHALEWLDHRHETPSINDMLRTPPPQRRLKGKTIAEWVSDELSQPIS